MSTTTTGKLGDSAANWVLRMAGIVLAFILSVLVLLVIGASPLDAFQLIFSGAVSSPDKLAYVMTAWAPLLLCSAGLLLTFSAGLWNIGIEGQIVLGAIFATGVMRALQGSAPVSGSPGDGRTGVAARRRSVGAIGRGAASVWERKRDLRRPGS